MEFFFFKFPRFFEQIRLKIKFFFKFFEFFLIFLFFFQIKKKLKKKRNFDFLNQLDLKILKNFFEFIEY